MPYTPDGRWYPELSDKQLQVFNCRKRALLVCGPRMTGKTRGTLHRICRHLWETKDARVAMFSRTIKNSKEGGTWELLHREVLKEWINADIGMRYTTLTSEGRPGPKVDGLSRTPYFEVTNCHGGSSKLMLFSLDFDGDIEDKMMEMEFSMVYFSELAKFHDRKMLSIGVASLRMGHLRYEDHQWIADTNPSDEGESSWIYGVWYRERNQTYEEYVAYNKKRGLPTLAEEEFTNQQSILGLIEITPDENPFVDPRQLREIKTTYAYDPGLYARYVEGKWIYGDGDSSRHFRSHFKPSVHVLGNIEDPEEENWERILPSDNCSEIITGWDIGETNHAVVAVERIRLNNQWHFSVLDEQVCIGQEMSVIDFSTTFMEEIVEKTEQHLGHEVSWEWAYSDQSSLNKYSATGDTFPYKQVEVASGGRITLIGVPKPHGSVHVRVQLLKQLLAQGRIRISAHCTYVIQMLRDLKRGKGVINYVVSDQNKHAFDALTYALLMECAQELEMNPLNVGKRELPLIVQV